MTQALDGSRGPARAVEASPGLQAQFDLPKTPPSATLQVTASTLQLCTSREVLRRPVRDNCTLLLLLPGLMYPDDAPGSKLDTSFVGHLDLS